MPWCERGRVRAGVWLQALLAASCLALPAYATADPLRERLAGLVSGELMAGSVAQPVRVRKPEFPEAVLGLDGWVQISFDIAADGRVINPVIEQTFGSSQFSRAALKELRKSVFSPSRVGGQPVLQEGNVLTYTFDTQSPRQEPWGATKKFNGEFWKVMNLLASRKVNEAEDRLNTMRMRGPVNVYEMCRLELLSAEIAALRGDDPLQLMHLRAALTGSSEQFMDPRLERDIKERIFLLESQLLELRSALRTFDSLTANSVEPPGPEIQEVVAGVRVKLTNGDPLVFNRTVAPEAEPGFSRPSWRHELVHRRFAFLRADASVGEFEVRCAKIRLWGNVDSAYYWEVPVHETDCQLIVFGSARAELKLVDYPAPAEMSASDPPQT